MSDEKHYCITNRFSVKMNSGTMAPLANVLKKLKKILSLDVYAFGLQQPAEVFFKKKCSQKLRKIHRKTLVPESLF